MPDGAGCGVVADPPIAFVRSLRGDAERVGDVAPCCAPVERACDRVLGSPLKVRCFGRKDAGG